MVPQCLGAGMVTESWHVDPLSPRGSWIGDRAVGIPGQVFCDFESDFEWPQWFVSACCLCVP